MDTCSELPWTGCCYKASPPDLGELQAQGIWSEHFSEEDKDQQEDQAASLGEEEEVQSEGHSEDTLHHLASRLSTKLKDRALLRGTSLAHVLEGLGKHLRSSALPAGNQVAEAIFQKSCPVTRIDYFISHCWSDSRSGKVFALWIHSNLNAAMVASSVVAAACTVLGRYRLLPVVAPRDLGFVFFPWALLLGGCCFFFVLGSWQRVLARLGRPVFYFLDKSVGCIDGIPGTDLELKHAGVASFGAFVALSDRMLLLWSPAYFTRLWCMLEVSAMVKTSEHHAELPIEFVSLQLATLSFYLWATGFFVLAAVQVNTVVSKPLADVYFIGITVLIAAYFQMAAFRQTRGPAKAAVAMASLAFASTVLGDSSFLAVPRDISVSPSRRALAMGTLTTVASVTTRASAAESWTALVGSDGFATVAEALKAVPKDCKAAVVTVLEGTYRERLLLPRGPSLTLEAQKPGSTTLIWESEKPYEAVLTAEQGSQVTVRGFNIKHAGKSVANNYAIFSSGGDLTLEDCDVTSSTGAGVAAEGGRLALQRCRVHDCARQGAVLFGPIIGDEPLQARCSCSVFTGNGLLIGDNDAIPGPFDGILARNNVEASISDVVVEGSGLAGLAIMEDTRVETSALTLRGNRQGSSRVKNGGELVAVERANDSKRYAFDRRSLEQQLRTFAVQQAECSDPKDRAMIEETIHSWFGDVEVCNRQIRETIGDKVMASLGPARHYPTRMLVPILLRLGWMVPLSFRLCHCFVDRRRTRFRDSLLNCALAMVVTIGWLGGWYVNYFFVGFEMLPPWLSIPVLAAQFLLLGILQRASCRCRCRSRSE
eukprot:s194_g18.t3